MDFDFSGREDDFADTDEAGLGGRSSAGGVGEDRGGDGGGGRETRGGEEEKDGEDHVCELDGY